MGSRCLSHCPSFLGSYMRSRLIFLDVDGVLNATPYLANLPAMVVALSGDYFDPAAVELLNQIVEATDCDIVLSSAWRCFFTVEEFRSIISSRGFKYSDRIIDRTPTWHGERGAQIQTWLNKNCDHKRLPKFVIIDDTVDDMGPLMPYVVETSFEEGLTMVHVHEVIQRLTPEETYAHA